jgi:hypothetical protein
MSMLFLIQTIYYAYFIGIAALPVRVKPWMPEVTRI